MNSAIILKAIDTALAIVGLLQRFGINFQEVIDTQNAADAEGREMSDAELQGFVNQAQDAIDRL